MIDPAALAETHWNIRSALHIARGVPSLGRWEDRTPQAKAYLIEAMRLTLEARGLLPKESKQEPLEGQLALFGE
jgi:hypothetical protein